MNLLKTSLSSSLIHQSFSHQHSAFASITHSNSFDMRKYHLQTSSSSMTLDQIKNYKSIMFENICECHCTLALQTKRTDSQNMKFKNLPELKGAYLFGTQLLACGKVGPFYIVNIARKKFNFSSRIESLFCINCGYINNLTTEICR